MRFIARTLVAVLIVAGCREAAAEAGSSWWPFQHRDSAKLTQPSSAAAAPSPAPALPPSTAGPVQHQVLLPQSSSDSANAAKENSSWFHMPHFSKTDASKEKKAGPKRNAWAAKQPQPAPSNSPLQKMKNGAHSVAEGTKSAYHKTVSALTPGQKTTPRPSPSHVAKADKPPLWKRMFGAKQPEPQKPATIPGFLAQKRIDP
jgi:hypothetical protein